MLEKYIILSNGRTGSNWLATTLSNMVQPTEPWFFDLSDWSQSLGPRVVLHTHQADAVLALDPEQAKKTTLVIARRYNLLDTAISHFVARYTDEWFHYSDREFEPIAISHQEMFLEITEAAKWHREVRKKLNQSKYKNVVEILFEDMVANSTQVEKFLANKLGLDYTAPSQQVDIPQQSSNSFRNPRQHHEIVKNYNQLKSMYDAQFIEDAWHKTGIEELTAPLKFGLLSS
jgi:LPS sulfotransferase NodH